MNNKDLLKNKESVYHFVTVIGIMLEGNPTSDDYDRAINYTQEFIQYRYNPKDIYKVGTKAKK